MDKPGSGPVMCLSRVEKGRKKNGPGSEQIRQHRYDTSSVIPRTHVPLLVGIIIGVDHDDHAKVRKGREKRLTSPDENGSWNTGLVPGCQETLSGQDTRQKRVFDTEYGKGG
jgi:hypothetical protein